MAHFVFVLFRPGDLCLCPLLYSKRHDRLHWNLNVPKLNFLQLFLLELWISMEHPDKQTDRRRPRSNALFPCGADRRIIKSMSRDTVDASQPVCDSQAVIKFANTTPPRWPSPLQRWITYSSCCSCRISPAVISFRIVTRLRGRRRTNAVITVKRATHPFRRWIELLTTNTWNKGTVLKVLGGEWRGGKGRGRVKAWLPTAVITYVSSSIPCVCVGRPRTADNVVIQLTKCNTDTVARLWMLQFCLFADCDTARKCRIYTARVSSIRHRHPSLYYTCIVHV